MHFLDELEAESIYLFREVAAQFKKPVLLFSGGKDSTVMVYLAKKAFFPCKIPLPLLHIDTGHNFPEALEFRDELVKQQDLQLITAMVADTIAAKGLKDPDGKFPSRNALQSVTLMDAIEAYGFDACIGGGRRDEEKARSKERIFSLRDKTGAWKPENQRPELWDLYNGRIDSGEEHMRIFPISNWTEADIWNYIKREHIPLPSIYFAHMRTCILHNGKLIATSPYIKTDITDTFVTTSVRYRTVGDIDRKSVV